MGRRDASAAPPDEQLSDGVYRAGLLRALSSAKGQRTLRNLERALLAIPDRRLAYEEIAKDGMVCAIGAYAVWDKLERFPWLDREAQVKSLEKLIDGWREDGDDIDLALTAEVGGMHGIAWTLAWEIASANDYLFGPKKTPEQRWRGMLKWVRQRIIRKPATPTQGDDPLTK